MTGHNDAWASDRARIYQAAGDQHIVEHHHHAATLQPGPDSVRHPTASQAPLVLRDRDKLMGQLRSAVSQGSGSQVYVLHGLGGCGKTAIAHELFRHATDRAGRIGLWVNASDASSLRAGMLAVAADRGAPEGQLHAARSGSRAAADLVWERLDASEQPWLLVLDNADDPGVLGNGGWLRTSPRGTVLVTTRQSGPRWWPGAELLQVGVLPRVDAARVLCDLAPEAGTEEEAAEVADRLGHLPLALTLAGGFLAHQVIDPWTMTRYSRTLETTQGRDPIELIDQGAESLNEVGDSRHLVSSTWQFSLNSLVDQGLPESVTLLRLLACWSDDPLPVNLLAGADLGPRLPAARVEAALRGLLDQSLTSLVPGEPRALRTHGVLLHSVARGTPEDERAQLMDTAARLLAAMLPEVPERTGTNPLFSMLAPHALALLRRAVAWEAVDRVTVESATECVWRLVVGLHRTSDYASALSVATEAVGVAEQCLGEEARWVLRLRQRMGKALHRAGRFEEAAAVHGTVLDACERAFGPNDADTLESCRGLAQPLCPLGRAEEAAPLARRAVAVRNDTLGPLHPLSLIARLFLLELPPGVVQPEEIEAGPELLEDCRRALTAEHQITLAAELDYAYSLMGAGRPAEALPFAEKALAGHTKQSGPLFPTTLACRALLSTIFAALGRRQEAVEHGQASAEGRLEVLGPDHPWTLVAQKRLAERRDGPLP